MVWLSCRLGCASDDSHVGSLNADPLGGFGCCEFAGCVVADRSAELSAVAEQLRGGAVKATDILMEEHRVIERVLAAMAKATERLEQGVKIDASFFLNVTDFIAGFADGCHHQKEEGVLFEAMTGAGIPRTEGPIAVMLAEHERARAYTRGLREAAQRLAAGDEQAVAEVIENARGYAELLRQHIEKEDRILFPLAERVIPASMQEQVVVDFARVEHEGAGEGAHEKYLALANELERQVKS